MKPLLAQGTIRKMCVTLDNPVKYALPVGCESVSMNELVGHRLTLQHTGRIECIHCGRETSKSFHQGYCFPCFKTLAECDLCILRPETCHFHLGTCRDPTWAQSHCMQPHIVYLSNTSGLKVGITRESQVPTRWIDQGASAAIPVFRVTNRYHSGLIEAALKPYVSDRTDWRRMLKGPNTLPDLAQRVTEIMDKAQPGLDALRRTHDLLQWEVLNGSVLGIQYPVREFPAKVASLNFDKTRTVEGVLQGIKGQYLILESGVINMRKFAGYEVRLSA